MSKAGDVIENPVTGERGVARIGTEETGGVRLTLVTSGLSSLLFSQSLGIHRHEEVIQRLSQRGMGKDPVAKNGIRELPHHGDLQYSHHFPAFHAKDRAT